jgi:hypothetical protein
LMSMCNLSLPRLPMIHDQQSLTHCCRSFSWWGREGIAMCSAYNGGQKFHCDSLHPINSMITQDAWPKIVDGLLTLIFQMVQRGYCNLFCQRRQPKIPLWLTSTYRGCNYPERMSTIVDALFTLIFKIR